MSKKPKWIEIKDIGNPGKKTKRFLVKSKDTGDTIGYIIWHPPWRKYCFAPLAGTIFEWICMRDISNFIQKATKKHYENKKGEEKTG